MFSAFDDVAQLFVEGRCLDKGFDSEVHSVAPVLVRIGRVVDLFLFRVRAAQCGRDGQQVLQGE